MLDVKERIDDTARPGKEITERGAEQARGATQAAGDTDQDVTSGLVGAVKEKMHDVAAGASEMVGKARDKAQEWACSVGDAAIHAKDKALQVASATVETAGDLSQDATALVRRYPIQALLVAIGAGFLLGQVLHSRSTKRA
jgi:hypothetical protein